MSINQINGLQGEAMWDLCNTILVNLGIDIDFDSKDFNDLLQALDGHPLTMRIVLPMLKNLHAKQVLETLQRNINHLKLDSDEATGKLYASLMILVDRMPDALRELLIPMALHERFLDSDALKQMAASVNRDIQPDQIDQFIGSLLDAGLLAHLHTTLYSIHPDLTGFLRTVVPEYAQEANSEKWIKEFITFCSQIATRNESQELHKK